MEVISSESFRITNPDGKRLSLEKYRAVVQVMKTLPGL
jgi:hypothetical protein